MPSAIGARLMRDCRWHPRFCLAPQVKASAHPESQDSRGSSRIIATVASLLQAIGIGSLLPLPGFLLLVLGDVAVSLLLDDRHSTAEDLGAERDSRRARRPLHGYIQRRAG